MTAFDDNAVERLTALASEFTGFSRDAILPDAIRRAAARLGSPEEVVERAARGDRAVVHALCQAVSVGETFFFRQPEHFRFIAGTLLPELTKGGRQVIRAWSAGCATGEETYSLAACLLDLSPVRVEVLGTDLLERNLAAARAGTYGAWSRRASGPMLHDLFRENGHERVSVADRLRKVTRFELHNLLEPAPGEFDLIFCRNVLVYFSPDAVKNAVRNLTHALAHGGAIFFGSMDVGGPPPGLAPAGPGELQIFRHERRAVPRPKPPDPPSAAAPMEPKLRAPEPVALHLRALVHIERGDKKTAAQALDELTRAVPDYVPGILERALLHVRNAEPTAAASLMREVLRRTEKLPLEEVLAGPEPLPVSFYRDSAQTFLKRGAP
ncbi:MAG: CheR family methyltransferase [Myxococcales bacterium]